MCRSKAFEVCFNDVYFRVAVYRFTEIHLGSFIARLKLLQTLVAVGIVPLFVWKCYLGDTTVNRCILVCGLAIFAVVMLLLASRQVLIFFQGPLLLLGFTDILGHDFFQIFSLFRLL